MKTPDLYLSAIAVLFAVSCKKEGCPDENATNYDPEAEKSDGSCIYNDYTVPDTYTFKNESGQSTVSYQGQKDRLNQLSEMIDYLETGTTSTLNAQDIKDMFANTNGDGNGQFSFSSTKNLEDKCFGPDVSLYKNYMDSIAVASNSNGTQAAANQAGTLSSGSSTYLFSANGIQYSEMLEKGLMGAVFMNQALNVYFGDDKMNVDNESAEDPDNGDYYTTMEHHFDEAFGYFGVPTDFPGSLGEDRFWGKYCNSRNAQLGSNAKMINNFIEGRAAVANDDIDTRDEAIKKIRENWELICAAQAVDYLKGAKQKFGNDQAKYLHELSEGVGFIQSLRYLPGETRNISMSEVNNILADFNDFWDVTTADLTNAIDAIESKYNF